MKRRNTPHSPTRREFLQATGLAGAGFWIGTSTSLYSAPTSPNEKLNIAVIGCGGKGYGDTLSVSGENIVALCDVDEQRAAKAFKEFPNATKYHDYRVLFDKEKSLDAVVVSTPDHNHAAPSLIAMRRGLHCTTQKPLTHDMYEARLMRDVARQMKVATQMGNQGTSSSGLRRGVEVIQAGAIGNVTEAHVWTNRPIWPQGIGRPAGYKEVPAHLKWDCWLGTAPWRPYNDGYAPFDWRGWWDFGTGALGDMACHTANLAYMALKLTSATRCDVLKAEGQNDESAPKKSVLLLHFPARENMVPVKFYWYDGGYRPPEDVVGDLKLPSSGSMLVGDKGKLFSPNDYGTSWTLLPKEQFEDYKGPEPSLPRSPGHYREWLIACKGGPAAMSNFDYAAGLTEAILLGNAALRACKPGGYIDWDAENLKVTNIADANKYVRREYRQGWKI